MSIGRAANILGVSKITLRRWDSEGKFPSIKTKGGHRRYDLSKLKPETTYSYSFSDNRKTIAYARVSSHDQKNDLERQKQVLELTSALKPWLFYLAAK